MKAVTDCELNKRKTFLILAMCLDIVFVSCALRRIFFVIISERLFGNNSRVEIIISAPRVNVNGGACQLSNTQTHTRLIKLCLRQLALFELLSRISSMPMMKAVIEERVRGIITANINEKNLQFSPFEFTFMP